jgi:hypothetical protein
MARGVGPIQRSAPRESGEAPKVTTDVSHGSV